MRIVNFVPGPERILQSPRVALTPSLDNTDRRHPKHLYSPIFELDSFDTKSNKAIGQPLIFFDSYADEKLPKLPANNTAFSVTMPKLKANQCTTGGECVLQWHWVGTAAKQTYQSCVDFVQG
ncbi:hypothetical protein MCOR27_004587 [Pyricularia oryzae]|nr:hypothetical protein MCOR27_004587 [Pyricularia oryzae]KAI6602686.1 hypothetical protein MCOR12_003583 [Pyricularia oryzae]